MFRTTRALRRTWVPGTIRRRLHEDSRNDKLGFSSPIPPDPRFGMDMTRAPGYEILAEDPSPVGNQKLVEFAITHARLSSAQIEHAHGYMWVGSVLYPTNIHPDRDIDAPWDGIELDVETKESAGEREKEAENHITDVLAEEEIKAMEAEDTVEVEETEEKPDVLRADRRYNNGQARRIRKERERSAVRKAQRRLRRKPPAVRKPCNDIPEDAEM